MHVYQTLTSVFHSLPFLFVTGSVHFGGCVISGGAEQKEAKPKWPGFFYLFFSVFSLCWHSRSIAVLWYLLVTLLWIAIWKLKIYISVELLYLDWKDWQLHVYARFIDSDAHPSTTLIRVCTVWRRLIIPTIRSILDCRSCLVYP